MQTCAVASIERFGESGLSTGRIVLKGGRKVPAGVEQSPDFDGVWMLDVEHDVREPADGHGAQLGIESS